MLDLKKVMIPIMLVILLMMVIPHSEVKANQSDIIVSLELNYGKVGNTTRTDFQIEGMCTLIVAFVEYDPTMLKWVGDYKKFWQKTARVMEVERGLLKIKAETDYPVPRRSQVLQLRFIPLRRGKSELKIIEEYKEDKLQAKYKGNELNVLQKRNGKVWALIR